MSAILSRCHRLLVAVALPLAVMPAAAAPRRADAAAAAAARGFAPVALPYRRFVMPSGLTVLVHTDHSVPTVFVGLWYRVGAKDEPAGRTGFAHLFEHLMFQPTARRGGDFLSAIAALGGTDVNGMTTGDVTRFFETVPTGALDRTLWMEADRMAHLGEGIDQAALDRQRAVVKNEKRQGEIQPGAASGAHLLATLYPAGHPYGHAPIGSMADLDRATLAQVKAWFADYYGPANAVLVLSGDIDAATARSKVARFFGTIPAGTVPAPAAAADARLSAIRRETMRDAVPNASLVRTWLIPSAAAHDLALLQLVAATLVSGREAPLRAALTGPGGPALGVSAGLDEQALVSTLSIAVALRPGASPDRVGRLIDDVLARYRTRGPDPRALPAILLPAEAQLLRSLDRPAAVGRQLGDGLVAHDDPAYVLQQRRWYAAASAASLRAVASRWLSRPYHQLLTLPGGSPPPAEAAGAMEEPAATNAAAAAIPADLPPVAAPDGRVAFPRITRMTLPGGLRLVVAERPRLPMVEFALRFPVGRADDPAGQPGLTEQAVSLLTAGTTRLGEADLERAAGGLGLAFTVQVGERSSSIGWTTPAATLDRSFALAAEVLRHPAYPAAALARRGDEVRAGFDARERVPQNAAPELLERAIRGPDHPLGAIARRGDPASATRQALTAFHDSALRPSNATLYAIGDITPARARALAERYLTAPVAAPPPARSLPPAAPGPRIVLVDAPGAAQSTIAFGELVRPFDAAAAPAERIADAALAGAFSSRLNTELRERRGWSYGIAGGIADAPDGARLFSATGNVETDRTAQSVALIARTMADFVGKRPLTPEELATYRDSAIRAIPAALTSGSDILRSMMAADALRLPPDHARGAAGRLAGVTLAQARQAAQDLYDPQRMSWVIVGDLKRIEPAVRALALAPVEVWDVYGRRLR